MIKQGHKLLLSQAELIKNLTSRKERVRICERYSNGPHNVTEGMIDQILNLRRPVPAQYVRPIEAMLYDAKKKNQKYSILLADIKCS